MKLENIKKFYNILFKPYALFYYLCRNNILRFLADEHYLKLCFRVYVDRELNLDNPSTFNEKMQWLKLNNRNKKHKIFVDKIDVKQFIGEVIGKEYLIPTIKVFDSVSEIQLNELPDKFVIKCTHDSGSVVVCKDKSTFNFQNCITKLSSALQNDFYYSGREWPYKNLRKRIIVEEYIEDNFNKDLRDYKFFVFNGNVKCIQVDYNRFTNHQRNFYNVDWEYINFTTCYPTNPDYIIRRPKNLSVMVELAEKISSAMDDIPFVRVDFYNVNGRILFGELTLFHGSGFERFYPDSWDLELGKMLNL